MSIPLSVSAATVPLLGLPIHNVDMAAALDRIDGYIRSGRPHHVVTADASMLVMAQSDSCLHAILERADLITPDSAGILWAARRSGRPLRERVSGVEIVERLCALSPERGYRIFFLGAGPGVAQEAAERMSRRYPGCKMVGARHGYFTDEEMPQILSEIREAQPDVLCVALGIPKQEKWIQAHRDECCASVLIGVGGTLDVLSGRTRRAPRFMQALRLEWLWRVLSNPRKINKVLLLPRFVRLVKAERRA
jgi:N-acetylglucosaminyldiphosphoundecaprenol N-acetyl-beta-D-mannosaminyltransferase